MTTHKQFQTAGDIVAYVAKRAGMTARQLKTGGPSRQFAWPRQFAMYLMRRELRMSYEKIARIFNTTHDVALRAERSVTERAAHHVAMHGWG